MLIPKFDRVDILLFMLKKNFTYIPFFALMSIVGCTSNSTDTATYFGGKIINPKSNFVVLYSMGKVVDTLYLDAKNKFLGRYKDVKEGLYYFVHGQEHQFFYLEKKDSLLLRLNTWDFDESLVFAGKGAERNNILIDCFLEDEMDKKKFYIFNQFESLQFKQKADSLLAQKQETYNDYIKNHPEETKGYKDILKITLTYPIYAKMERYPMAHVKYSKQKTFPEIGAEFYNYRKNIDITKDSLLYYLPYSYYIKNFLYNNTYSLGHAPMTKEYSSDFTIDLLKTIGSKIVSKTSKNAFLKRTVIDHFYRKSSCNINESAFDTYFELSTNKEDKTHIKRLLNDSKYLTKGTVLSNFFIQDFTNSSHSIKDIVSSKNAFLFFWNPKYISKNYLASRVNYLSSKYPEIKFISIKIDGSNTDRIKKLDIKNQFFIQENNNVNAFLTSKMPRAILVNKKGIVVNGFASISSNNIHYQLNELSKK